MALIIKNKQSIDLKTDDAENKAENKRSYSLDDFLKWRNEQQKKQGYSLKSFEEWEAKKNEAETVFKEAEEAMREAALNQTKAISAAKQFVNPETPSNVVEKVRVDAASELLKPNTSVMQRRDVGKSGITLVDEIAKEAAADVAVKEAVRDYGISAGSPNKSVKEEKHANVEKAKQALAETKVARSETSDSINQKLRETIESDPVLNRLVTDYWQKAWEYSQPIGEGQTAAQADAMRDAAYEDMMQAREVLTRLGYDADALKDAYAQVANKEETEKIIKDYTEYAKEHPVSATVKSIGLNAAGSLSALSGMLESTIKGEDVDTNSPAYAQLNAANALREGVSEDLSPGAQFAYNTGISMADSLLMMPMGTLGTVVMGANALAQTSKDVLDKGGTKAQAWATGLVAGIAETLLEKVSLDQLKVFAKMPGRGFLAFMKNVGKGMVTEGSEELFTEIVNVIGDALINGGNSDIEQRYNDYVKSGMNKEAAWKQTAADYAKQMGLSFLGGAVSGGVFGAGSQLIGDLAQKIKDIDVGKEVRKMGDAEISAQVEEGLKAEDGTEQKRVAEKLNKKLTENEEYSDADVGAVAIENTRARVEKVETQMAASPELEKEIESADKEAGNSIARTAITDLYVRANRILEGEIDLARSSEELDRTADAVRSNKKLSDSQKNAIIKAVDNVKERLTETAESRPKQAESAAPAATEVTPEVMAEREARAAKATNEIERSGILSGADDKQIKEVMGIADVFRQHGSTLKVRFSADYDVINGTPNGIYAPTTNTIYVNPKAKNPFAQVIAHELVHRMAYNSGNLYNDFLRAVTAFYSSKGISIDQLAKQKVKEYATFGIALDENQSREEVAAAFVEEYVRDRQAIRSLVRKHRSVAEWFRLRLRGLLGWLKPQQTKEARYLQDAHDIFSEELRGVDRDGLTPKQRELKAIDDQYASGEITGEEHDRLAAEIEGKYGESYSISADVQAEYERNVDAVLDGTYSSPDPLIVGRTPDVLRLIGFAELPVVITPNHIYSIAKTESEAKADGRYNARTNYHGLGERAVKDIMKSISNPLMVVMAPDAKEGKSGRNSAHRVIVITETMVDGKRVVSPIEVDADVRMNDQYYDTNLVASYYAKDSLKKIISEVVAQETIGNTAIYYGDKKRISDFVKDLGFQLPAAFKDIRNSIRTTDFVKDLGFQLPANFKDIRNSDVIIRDIGENVNKGIENVTQSKQFKRWFGDWQNDPASASKVVNKDGTPKVVYHGTNAEFTIFDRSKGTKRVHLNVMGGGNYFTSKKSGAEKYGDRIVEAYLSIKNPYIFDSKQYTTVASQIAEEFGIDRDSFTGNDAQRILKDRGYDGIILYDVNGEIVIANAFDSNQIKSATENVGTFSASNTDIRYSISPAVDENGKQKIAAGMSDEQRYDILKGKSIRVAFYDKDKYEAARPRIKDINEIKIKDTKPILRKLANEFGAIRVYKNSDVELEFEYTNNGVNESVQKQRTRFDDYVKFLTIAEHVIENAKGLECHTDRYSGTPRADITNAGDFILIGAFEDEDGIVPVKLLVKQFTDKPNKLYVAITVNKIEAEIVTLAKGNTAKHHPAPSASTSESEIVALAKGNTAKHHPAPSDSTNESEIVTLAKGNTAKHHPAPSDSEYSLTQILENVNPADKTLIKYIPDGFLDDAQLAAKAEAIKEERDYVERKTGVSYSISFDGATPVNADTETESEAEQEALALDEADAEVAVPYEDEEGNLRFTSLAELTPEEESLYSSMPAVYAQDAKVFAEENEKLKRSVEYLKGQFKVTEGYVPQEQAVRRMIRQIASDYRAKGIDANALSERVINVAKDMNRGRIDAREAYDRYVQIARVIVDAQEEQTNPLYEEYAELRNYLRSTAITMEEQYRGDFDEFGGWNDFRKGVMGIMKLSNEGISVDMAYDEITGMFPGLLDESIINPADRMKELARLANSLRAVYENTFTENMAESEAESLGAVIGSQVSELPEAKTYADRMKDARYKAAQDVRDAYRVQMERLAQRTQEQLEALERSFKERDAARALAVKKRQEERIRRDRSRGKYVSLDKIAEAIADGTFAPKMIAVHKKLKEYRNAVHVSKQVGNASDIAKYTELAENTAKYIEAVGRRYRQLRDNESLEALGNFHEWEGKEGLLSGLRYATETPTRIIEDIAPNEAAAKRMLAYAFDPVRKNEANRQRWIRDLRARVKALKIGTKKEGKNANTESEAVQLVGEYMHIIDLLGGKRRMYGMDKGEWQKALDDFKAKNPDMKWPEVESKAKAMREIYDEIYDELSNVLVTNGYPPVNKRGGYFPHFSENEPDSVLGKAAAAIGLQIQGNELPTSIYGLTANFKPGKSYFGNLNRRTGNNTTYDALRGFEIYINGASNVIHHTDDIQRLRSLARVIRKESADPDTKKKIEELVNARDGLTDEQKDMQINEMLKDAKFKLAGFASWLDEYTNGLANKKSKYDRSMEELLGRTIYSLVGQLEGRVAANMVALNPGSWLTNFIPLTQARALIGDKYMLKAAAMAVANAARDDGFTDMSDFLVSRKGSDPVVMAMSDRVSSFLSRPMEWIDGFASQTIVRARYMQNVEKHGMSEEAAMAEANVFAGKVMADRSKGATPTIFNSKNPLIKVFTQFQIEQNNQLRYLLKDIPKETEKAQRAILALMGAMMKFAVGAYLFNDLYEYFIGRRPAFDILGIVNNTFGSAVGYKLPNIIETIVEVTGDAVKGEMKEPGEYFETKKKGIAPALGEGGTELLENLPFVGGVLGGGRLPIANAIGNPLEVAGEALALIPTVDEETGEVVQNGSWQRLVKTAYDELSKPIYYLAPKFGGGQMKKVLEGTFAVAQHGSYTYNKKGEAQLQYPVLSDNNLQTALNWGAAVIFGKTTTPWAREWIENSFKTRTVGETAAYKAMIEIGEQSSDAYAVLDRVKEAKAEHSRLDKKGNSPYDSGTEAALAMLKADNTLQEISKAQVYKHLLASSDEKEYLYATIRYQDPGLYRVLTGMRDVTAGGDVSAKAQKQELILNSDLSDAAKVKVYRVKAASDEDEEFMDRMKQQGVSEITTLKVITKAGAATKNSEKYKAVSTTTMTESQRNAFMKQIMTDSQYSKYNLANSKGITTAVWAQFTARLEAVNASGAASQQEAAKALAGMNITQNQKAAIWQLQNKGWKAENNPFNPKVGALIKEQME